MRRREFVGGAAATVLLPAWLEALGGAAFAAPADPLAAIASEAGGRLGVSVLDTGTGRRLWLDPLARYPLCSTFKVPLAAAILARADRGELDVQRPIRFTQGDLLEYAPVVRENLSRGEMTLAELCAAAIEWSDNAAANLLLPQLGGPSGLTRFLRSAGDSITRLDRVEPELNEYKPGELRDTTTPMAMTTLLAALLTGDVLQPTSRKQLADWMIGSRTGDKRLRAGLPKGWRVGDKTGTSGNGQANDIAIAWPPNRKPILIACYLDAPGIAPEKADRAIASVGALVGQLFA
ncbi:class A beta-lactamase [Sphingomonas desiccabilis]|uniref:Beta-lactamase n=1 Tax=Sphingomonas desiccabilis TaxID=429134 RepID=A0A4Q2IWF2_9SPHN|nr:class A beta-lactamase [Sphingomonas desiccabilis]MBB3910266.1 beta-lactamase class A [Sphingomonas desiccabilis]RXZ34935.1 class A beta-lactamase [Sphingomonas desiccabilis]